MFPVLLLLLTTVYTVGAALTSVVIMNHIRPGLRRWMAESRPRTLQEWLVTPFLIAAIVPLVPVYAVGAAAAWPATLLVWRSERARRRARDRTLERREFEDLLDEIRRYGRATYPSSNAPSPRSSS